jgi:hypothetical protein
VLASSAFLGANLRRVLGSVKSLELDCHIGVQMLEEFVDSRPTLPL